MEVWVVWGGLGCFNGPANVTGSLYQFVYCMAFFYQQKQKQVKIITVIYYKMSILCKSMVNYIENTHNKGSCGILRYPVIRVGMACSFISAHLQILVTSVENKMDGSGKLKLVTSNKSRKYHPYRVSRVI